jgi:HlyD family secretion protein
VKVDAVADKEYEAHVVEIGSSATARAGSTTGIRYFDVKVAIENPDDRLRPGMTSQVDIITNQAKNVLMVPVQSVVERDPATLKKSTKKGEEPAEDSDAPKKKYVLTVVKDKTHAVEVTTGVSDATHVEIKSGLKGGEKIVTGPFRTLKNLKDDVAVKPEKESAASKTDTAAEEKND